MRPPSPAILLPLFLLLAGTSTAQIPIVSNVLPGLQNPINLQPEQPVKPAVEAAKRVDHETASTGEWELIKKDSGVSAMHLAITHENKAIFFDASSSGPSRAPLPPDNCRPDPTGNTTVMDCWAHAIEFDLATYDIRPLKILTNPWCSSGGFAPDGTLINTGGWRDGAFAVRYIGTCPNCDWRDYAAPLRVRRWYATQTLLGDGSFIVLGGRRAFNYEFVPAEKSMSPKLFNLPFLVQTTERVENNLYPFIHLSTDGNLFVFANNRSILLQPRTGQTLREFPPLPGGSRNYPASGMSALLPIDLHGQRSDLTRRTTTFPAQVLICGGSPPESFRTVHTKKIFLPALKSCGRLTITDPSANWVMEDMPVPRTIADMLNLPNGDILIINGASLGCAGWDFARDPVFTPLLYKPALTRAARWKELAPSTIPRMYHSTSAVLPDASIFVGGSNTNPRYNFSALFPTEMRLEKFRPPYLDPALAPHRPRISPESVRKELAYAENFEVEFAVPDLDVERENVKVTMYAPPFTTHGYSMNQRLLVLRVVELGTAVAGKSRIRVTTPPSGDIAPPGWYMLFVVNKGVPSEAVWIHIQSKVN